MEQRIKGTTGLMARNISFTVKYWKQDGPTAQGR